MLSIKNTYNLNGLKGLGVWAESIFYGNEIKNLIGF